MSKKRLAKFLAGAGVASRRKCEELIFEGLVRVNGKIVLLPQTLVDERDAIEVNGKKVRSEQEKVYFIVNKPRGCVCSAVRKGREKLVLDLFEGLSTRLFTVGRLDRDTSGLILVTNDGAYANRVIHPSSNIKKEYIVKTSAEISDAHLKTISEGILLEEAYVKPVKVSKMRRGTLKIVVSEGKKREVRYLVENAGLEVLELKRTRIGGLRLGTLPLGSWRAMTEREKEVIFE